MWVDTKGEDGPQCIHHTPVGALLAQPPPSRSCRSLHYALQNTLNSTSIRVACGTHKLQSYRVPPNRFQSLQTGISALRILGECATDQPTVQCLNGITITFKEFTQVEIGGMEFTGCGKQEHPKTADDIPTLYFSNCTNVSLQQVTVHITGQYGKGIVLTNIVAHGVISLYNVSVLHNGTYGSGIQCEINGNNQMPANNFSLYMNNIQVVNTNTHTEYDPSMSFDGITITARGAGSGTIITLHNVTVFNSAPVTGFGIFVHLSGDMHSSTVDVEGVNVQDGWNEHYSIKNESEVLADCAKRQLEMIRKSTKYRFYISFLVLVQTSHNTINVTGAHMVASYGPVNVYALAIYFKGLATLNRVRIENVSISAKSNPVLISRHGLSLDFADNTSENSVVAQNLQVVNSTTVSGEGVLVSFTGHCTRNSAVLQRSAVANQHVKTGGGLIAHFTDYTTNNTMSVILTRVQNNTAMQGGGMQVILSGSASENTIYIGSVLVAGNKANAGGGVCIIFDNSSERNMVTIDAIIVVHNTLIPPNIDTGGGILVKFATDKAMHATQNKVTMNFPIIIHNKAKGGVGGGLSVIYVHSPFTGDSGDEVHLNGSIFVNNQADYGQAFAMQSSPQYRKGSFRGITAINTFCAYTNATHFADYDALNKLFKRFGYYNDTISTPTNLFHIELASNAEAIATNIMSEIKKTVKPIFQIQTNTSLILLISVQIRLQGNFSCGAASQGILAVDSVVILQPDATIVILHCVASHGGAIALYGESYIRGSSNSLMSLTNNYAFQRGGAIYVHSAQHAQPRVHCFLQHEQGKAVVISRILFQDNAAKHEGQSVFISEAESCFDYNFRLFFFAPQMSTTNFYLLHLNMEKTDKLHTGQMCMIDGIPYPFCNGTSNTTIDTLPQIVSRPDHVDGAPIDLDNPVTVQFIPGKQKQLPHKHAYDRLGNVINTVFTVQIIAQDTITNVQLNPFSKYTADFTVILHGIPLKHGLANQFSNNESNITGSATPQLVLQSVDNSNLLLIMNIELQCCPPGYIYQKGSTDMGTCHCGMSTVLGIEECNETDPNAVGAVLQVNHWAGYLPSNDQNSCDEQKLFSAPCPPGYCQTQLTTLPNNNSMQLLEEVVCGGSSREGLLCGDCTEGNGIAVNFNGARPVCTSCQDGLSTVGLLVWFLSEWVPMLVVMFIVMLFNIDLISGRFNSFLLFAQLIALFGIRGDAELGPAHIAFVKIYRFLYGMWNLDFFSVLLPPYCLIPHSHLTLLQTLLLHYSIGLFPLIVAITLVVLERSAEKWICCHRVDQCLRRMRRWKAKYSDGMSYDRALPAFVILGFTRFLISSSYILANQTITGENGEERMVVWWQGSVPYGSIQHIAYFIPAIIILLVFVLLPAFLLLTLPIGPQLFGRLIIAVPPLRKLQRMQTFCSNVYTDRWIYHFVNVFQGCYKERFRSFSSLYLFHRIIQLLVAMLTPRVEDALHIQLILTAALLLLIAICQPYNSSHLNTLDTAILGNLTLILILSRHIADTDTLSEAKQFYVIIQVILIYLPLLYPGILLGRKVYNKCAQLRCCQKQEQAPQDDVEQLIEDPTERLGNFVRILELRPGLPDSSDEETETETEREEEIISEDQ